MIISSEEYSIIDSKDEISSQEYGEFLQTVFNDTYSKIDEFKKISVHIVFKVGNTFGDLNARADENAEPYVEIEKDFLRAVHKFYGTMANSSNRKFYEVIFPEIFDAKLVEKYTTYMQILSIRVLLIHELGHIYNGHLLEMMGKNANLSINEDERDYIEEDDMEIKSSPNLCVHSSSSYVSPSMLPLSSGDLIEWSLVCHSTLSYQKFCDRHSNHYDHPEELHQSVE